MQTFAPAATISDAFPPFVDKAGNPATLASHTLAVTLADGNTAAADGSATLVGSVSPFGYTGAGPTAPGVYRVKLSGVDDTGRSLAVLSEAFEVTASGLLPASMDAYQQQLLGSGVNGPAAQAAALQCSLDVPSGLPQVTVPDLANAPIIAILVSGTPKNITDLQIYAPSVLDFTNAINGPAWVGVANVAVLNYNSNVTGRWAIEGGGEIWQANIAQTWGLYGQYTGLSSGAVIQLVSYTDAAASLAAAKVLCGTNSTPVPNDATTGAVAAVDVGGAQAGTGALGTYGAAKASDVTTSQGVITSEIGSLPGDVQVQAAAAAALAAAGLPTLTAPATLPQVTVPAGQCEDLVMTSLTMNGNLYDTNRSAAVPSVFNWTDSEYDDESGNYRIVWNDTNWILEYETVLLATGPATTLNPLGGFVAVSPVTGTGVLDREPTYSSTIIPSIVPPDSSIQADAAAAIAAQFPNGNKVDLVDVPNATAVTAIQSELAKTSDVTTAINTLSGLVNTFSAWCRRWLRFLGRKDVPNTGTTTDFNAADGDYGQVGTFNPTTMSEQALSAGSSVSAASGTVGTALGSTGAWLGFTFLTSSMTGSLPTTGLMTINGTQQKYTATVVSGTVTIEFTSSVATEPNGAWSVPPMVYTANPYNVLNITSPETVINSNA